MIGDRRKTIFKKACPYDPTIEALYLSLPYLCDPQILSPVRSSKVRFGDRQA